MLRTDMSFFVESTSFIWFVGLVSFVRPTAAIPWLPLCLRHIRMSKFTVTELIIKRYLVIGYVNRECNFRNATLSYFFSALIGSVAIGIDTYAHGKFIVTPLEFLKYNIFNGIGSFYGTHPW